MEILANSIQDKNEFAKFIRDLSSNLTNVKHLLEDYENSKKEEIDKKKEKGKKKKLLKRKILSLSKIKKKRKELIKEDFKKIEYSVDHMDESGEKNPYDKIKNLKTKEGIQEYKFRLLDYYWIR